MEDKYSIAIVGNKETVLGFKALGLKTFNANSPEEARDILFKLKAEKINDIQCKYAIIFISEDLAMGIEEEDYKKLSQDTLPAIVPVPNSKGSSGYGIKRIGKMVERAVGSDIFKE